MKNKDLLKKIKSILVLLLIITAVILSVGCPSPNDSAEDDIIKSNENAISSFNFIATNNVALSTNITGTITGTNIVVTVPYGTDVTALIATFTLSGNSITVGNTVQLNGTTPNNFTHAVMYKVTAENGSFVEYSATITIAPSTAKELTAFSFTAITNAALSTNITGSITGTNIVVTVPYGTDVTALIATFTLSGKSITVGNTVQLNGTTPNNFTHAVMYKVTAENGSFVEYSATITIAPSTAKELTAFSFTAITNAALSRAC